VSPAPVRYEDLIGLWHEGQRRLGGPFMVGELAQLYLDQGTDWCFDIAVRVAPDTPAAWDMTTVAGAAFARYAREAIDYSTGRRVTDSDS
jgi:hypothetical protein